MLKSQVPPFSGRMLQEKNHRQLSIEKRTMFQTQLQLQMGIKPEAIAEGVESFGLYPFS